jgi:selenocysteine lyase/cysteine desulfurase
VQRRAFLGSLAVPAAALPLTLRATLLPAPVERAHAAEFANDARSPDEIARDEDFWLGVQQAFTVDRSLLNLNNGGICPAPANVQNAVKRHLDHAHTAPAYVLWRLQEPQRDTVRAGLARLFGADPEEIAITRNASESLENVQQGLELARGDEVLTTTQDYPRMLTTWRQRERRDGIVLKEIQIPVPCDDFAEIVRRFAAALTPRTRVLHICHVVNITGQIMPVKELAALAHAHGCVLVVDGAHSFGHLDFRHADLECDYFGTSLHKYLFAPHGTGMLYVRKEHIAKTWPLFAAGPELDTNIRKFEEIGTHAVANVLAIADAIAFHAGIGAARKQARLLYLRDTWAKRLAAHPRVKLHTSLAPGRASGVANFAIEGFDATKLYDHLWTKHRIFTVPIGHAECPGIRVSPALHTTLPELDRFCSAVEHVLAHGLPG